VAETRRRTSSPTTQDDIDWSDEIRIGARDQGRGAPHQAVSALPEALRSRITPELEYLHFSATKHGLL
jgi:hypothetical protein